MEEGPPSAIASTGEIITLTSCTASRPDLACLYTVGSRGSNLVLLPPRVGAFDLERKIFRLVRSRPLKLEIRALDVGLKPIFRRSSRRLFFSASASFCCRAMTGSDELGRTERPAFTREPS